jgi:hypothetical protein
MKKNCASNWLFTKINYRHVLGTKKRNISCYVRISFNKIYFTFLYNAYLITDVTLSQWILGRQLCCAQYSALAPDRRGRKGRKGSNIMGSYIPYDLLQTKGETCAKFGWDRLGNVYLYKVQKDGNKERNKQKRTKNHFIFIYKITNEVAYNFAKLSYLLCGLSTLLGYCFWDVVEAKRN